LLHHTKNGIFEKHSFDLMRNFLKKL